MTSHRGNYGHYGPPRRGRTLNAYERARQDPPSQDLYKGLNREPTETMDKPFLNSEAKEIQPKNLTCLGSYNWIEATVPKIIVPGELTANTFATLSVTPPHSYIYHRALTLIFQVHPGSGLTNPSRSPSHWTVAATLLTKMVIGWASVPFSHSFEQSKRSNLNQVPTNSTGLPSTSSQTETD